MIDRISSRYGHATIRRCDEGCRINVARSPRAVILKGERLEETGGKKMCDCIIFRNDTKIILVELKRRSMDPRSVHEKLLNGARAALKIWSESTDKKPALFFVLAAKSFADHTAYLRISRDRIHIKNDKYSIRTAKSGSNMAEIIKDYR